MDPSLRDAVLGAPQIQAPASPLGASQAPELAKLAQSSFQLPQSNQATGALAQQAGDLVQQQKAAAAAAKAAAKKKEADLADIRAYRIVKKSDGGYDFFDPTNKQVDIATLTQRTGTKPSELLKESENPIDIQYVQDYQNLQDYAQAILSGDKKKAQTYRNSAPELKKYDDRGGVQRLFNDFQSHYKRYYVPSAWGESPGSALVPSAQSENDVLSQGI